MNYDSNFLDFMKRIVTIILVNLMLLPVIWNGLGLLHYVVAHTHTFCTTDSAEHAHQTPADCISLCQLTNNQPHQQLPITNDYYELKTCLTSTLFFNTLLLSSTNQSNFVDPFLLETHFLTNIFHPPIG